MRPVVTLLIFFLSLQSIWATPQLSQMSPHVGAAIGEDVTIIFYGNHLENTSEVMTYAPGLQITEFVKKEKKKVTVKAKVDAKAKPGYIPLRLLTNKGATELRLFKVYYNKSVDEKEPNSKSEEAQLIENNVTIRGMIKREDVDRYKLKAKAGQVISIQVEALEYNARLFDTHISLFDDQGKELASNDDNSLTRQDAGISIKAPKEGTYEIVLREASYQGSNDEYLIHVGSFDRPEVIFPLAAAPNTKQEVQFLGTAHGPSIKKTIQFPAEVGKQTFYPVGSSTPNYIEVIDAPHIMEVEPNNNSKETQLLNLAPPFVVHGVINTENDYDDFSFQVKKGQRYDIKLYARSYGSSLDGHVYIYNEKYKHLANNDDKNGADSRVTFKADADGLHRLRIKDYLSTFSDQHVYAVEVRPQTERVSATIYSSKRRSQTLQSVYVPQGGQFAALVAVERVNTKSSIQYNAKDLPAGVEFYSKPVHEKVSKVPVVFKADAEKSKLGFSHASLELSSTDPKNPLKGQFNQTVELTYGDPNSAVHFSHQLKRLNVAVVDATPFKVRIQEFKTPIVRLGSKTLTVHVERKEGFDGEVKLKLLMDIPGVGSALEVKVPKGKTQGHYHLNANGGAQIGKWPCAVLASATVDGQSVYNATNIFELEVSEPYILANIDMAAVAQGQEVDVNVNFDHNKAFEGKAKVKLYGLPGKASSHDIEIDKATKNAFFKVKADKATPKGQHKSLFVNIAVIQDGETISHNVGGGGTLRVDPPPKIAPPKVASDKKAPPKPKRKTRLEILREQLLAKKS